MKPRSDIQRDLKRGDEGEQLVASFLSSFNIPFTFVEKSKREFYDIIATINGKKYTFEIKYDYYQKKSGNFAIEVHNTRQDKKSGLSITKSNFWIHILDDDHILLTKTTKLKKFCRENIPFKTIERAGDNNARVLLYKRAAIEPIFVNVVGMGTAEFLEAING